MIFPGTTIEESDQNMVRFLIKCLDSDSTLQWIFINLTCNICLYIYQSFYQKFLFRYSSFWPKTQKKKIENLGSCTGHCASPVRQKCLNPKPNKQLECFGNNGFWPKTRKEYLENLGNCAGRCASPLRQNPDDFFLFMHFQAINIFAIAAVWISRPIWPIEVNDCLEFSAKWLLYF